LIWNGSSLQTSKVPTNQTVELEDLQGLSEILGDPTILNIFPGQDYAFMFEQLGVKNIVPPWINCLPEQVCWNRLVSLCQFINSKQNDFKYYFGPFKNGNICLKSLEPLNNPEFYQNNKQCSSFYPDGSGDLDIPVYNRTSSITGRLKIVSGPEILSLPKELRKDLFKNRCIELDFNAIEPRLLYVLSTKKPVTIKTDFYTGYDQDFLNLNLPREKIKDLVLCSLYGKTASSLEEEELSEIVGESFLLESFRQTLIQERTQTTDGSIRNWFGRRIKPPVKNSNIINYYVQSTAIDFVLLCFSWLVKSLKQIIKPCFVLTDALYVKQINNISVQEFSELVNKTIKQFTENLFPDSEFPVKISCLN